MQLLVSAALALALLLVSPPGFASVTQDSDAETAEGQAGYAQILARLKSGDTHIDYRELRLAYARTEEYSPYGALASRDLRSAMYEALRQEEYAEALEKAEQLLEILYVDGSAHVGAMVALTGLGNRERADFHRAVARGLLDSICGDRDGRSIDDPCPVISTSEEYFYINSHGLSFEGQALLTCGEGRCDEMEVHDPETEESFSLFFDVSIPTDAMRRSLGE
jgi:hypothetical protein